jgi:putative ABC transport system permease protein
MGWVQEVRGVWRRARGEKLVASAAVLTLALGMGASTVAFGIANAVVFRGFPVPAGELVFVGVKSPDEGAPSARASYDDLLAWRESVRSVHGLAAYQMSRFGVGDRFGAAERVKGAFITSNAFTLIGVYPVLGRVFQERDERRGAQAVAVISDELWLRRYQRKLDVLGNTISVNGVPTNVVGVMAPGMKFPANEEIWLPLEAPADRAAAGERSLQVVGLLGDGVTRAQAKAEMDVVLSTKLRTIDPDRGQALQFALIPYHERFNGGPITVVVLILQLAVVCVLCIAGVNVAHLLLSRSLARSREIALHIALGASRIRVMRQALLEGALLAVTGGALGVCPALTGLALFNRMLADVDKPYWITFDADWRVCAYVAGLLVCVALMVAAVPAWQAGKTDPNVTIKEQARGAFGSTLMRRATAAILVAQIALSAMLLIGASLMIRSFAKLQNVDLGINAEGLLTMKLELAGSKYAGADARGSFYTELGDKLRAVPGVDVASVATHLPGGWAYERQIEIEGDVMNSQRSVPTTSVASVDSGYFRTLGIQILRGHPFPEHDAARGNESAIVNERWVARFSEGGDVVGTRVRVRTSTTDQSPWLTIVGVVSSVRQRSLQQVEKDPIVYVPLRLDAPSAVNILVRTSHGHAADVAGTVRDAVKTLDADQPVADVMTLTQFLDLVRSPYRVFGALFAMTGCIALLLAIVGVYAVTAYVVEQRRHELGVRMAVGANSHDILRLVIRRAAGHLGIGIVLGVLGGAGIGQLFGAMLGQISPFDPLTFSAVPALMVLLVVLACISPTRHVVCEGPAAVLRTQ